MGRSWGTLGALLGSPGPLGRLLGSLGALLGRSWGAPGSSWSRLGPLLGLPGPLLEFIWHPFWELLALQGVHFGAKLLKP